MYAGSRAGPGCRVREGKEKRRRIARTRCENQMADRLTGGGDGREGKEEEEEGGRRRAKGTELSTSNTHPGVPFGIRHHCAPDLVSRPGGGCWKDSTDDPAFRGSVVGVTWDCRAGYVQDHLFGQNDQNII